MYKYTLSKYEAGGRNRYTCPRCGDTGYVDTIEVAGQEVAGTAFRQALALRSACFSVSYSGEVFHILTHGYGHGVGLSQWGARRMAEEGASWQEILAHYFPGTEICE